MPQGFRKDLQHHSVPNGWFTAVIILRATTLTGTMLLVPWATSFPARFLFSIVHLHDPTCGAASGSENCH